MNASSSDISFIVLYIVFFLACLVHRWVCKAYYMQPKFNHPAVFWNPILRQLLCIGSLIIFLVIVVAAFFLSQSPWWFLLLAFSTLMLTTPNAQGLLTPKNIGDEADSWIIEKGIQLDSVRYSTYKEPYLARTPGATIIVGIGIKGTSRIGFVVEVLLDQGVLAGEIIEPYRIATYHQAAARAARQHEMCLIDALLLLAKQHQTQLNK